MPQYLAFSILPFCCFSKLAEGYRSNNSKLAFKRIQSMRRSMDLEISLVESPDTRMGSPCAVLYKHWGAEILILLVRLERERSAGEELRRWCCILGQNLTPLYLSKLSRLEHLTAQGNPSYKKYCIHPGFLVCLACCFKSLTTTCERYSHKSKACMVSFKQWHDMLKQNPHKNTYTHNQNVLLFIYILLQLQLNVTLPLQDCFN